MAKKRPSRARKTVAEELTHVVAWCKGDKWFSVRSDFDSGCELYKLLHSLIGPTRGDVGGLSMRSAEDSSPVTFVGRGGAQ